MSIGLLGDIGLRGLIPLAMWESHFPSCFLEEDVL
jgi:hypothetical protein